MSLEEVIALALILFVIAAVVLVDQIIQFKLRRDAQRLSALEATSNCSAIHTTLEDTGDEVNARVFPLEGKNDE